MRAEVRNIVTGTSILTIDRIVFVVLDEAGRRLAAWSTSRAS